MTLLTVDDLREWPAFAPYSTAALQLLLDAEEAAIEAELGGPVGSVVEVVDGRSHLTFLTTRRRIASVTSIATDIDGVVTTLAGTDWRLAYDARTIFRRGDGANPSYTWAGYVTVTYAAEDDELIRKRVQRELVLLDVAQAPGATSEQIGAWMEQQQKSSVWNQQAERAAILAGLWPHVAMDFA